MNKHSKGNIHLKSFRGETCKDISQVQPTLDTAKSDVTIIHVKTTDASAKRKRHSAITNPIISVGKKCQDTGVRNVMISSFVCRKSHILQAKINEVNDALRDFCATDGFVFTYNTNLKDCDVFEDLKVNSAFHPSKVDKMSARNFWELNGKK